MNQTFTQKIISIIKSYTDLKLNYKLGIFFIIYLVVFTFSIYFITSRDSDKYLPLVEAYNKQKVALLDLVNNTNKFVYQDQTSKEQNRKKIAKVIAKINKRQDVILKGGEFVIDKKNEFKEEDRARLFIDAILVEELIEREAYADEIKGLEAKNQDFYESLDFLVNKSGGMKKFEIEKRRLKIENLSIEIGEIYSSLIDQVESASVEYKSNSKITDFFVYVLIFIIFVAMLFITRVYITRPVIDITNRIKHVASGDLSFRLESIQKDEIGEMSIYLNDFISNLDKAAIFANKIGEGDFGYEYKAISDKDELGLALVNMRDRLKEISNQDKIRNWSTEGMAKFADLLQMDKSNLALFYESIIINLVKYLKANQGAIYVLNQQKEGEEYQTLTMKACYAWDRIKDESEVVLVGEGLVGQCVLERDFIHLTEVPNDFVKITSGLGEANPNSVLVSPLIVNDEIHGVIEMASFEDFESYQIDFVQKIGETIAATIANVKVGEKTKQLLEESQEMATTMKTQEEELRQNQEEMLATQEEMNRKILELEKELEQFKLKA